MELREGRAHKVIVLLLEKSQGNAKDIRFNPLGITNVKLN